MKQTVMHIFARTPVHVGAGNSVGVVDSPVQRERHTRIPIIPGSSLKGVLADFWNEKSPKGKTVRSDEGVVHLGNDDPKNASAGNLLVGEARVLAFPVRSAKGAFAWITCPLALARYKRDTGLDFEIPDSLGEDECICSDKQIQFKDNVILEEYRFKVKGSTDIWTHLKDAVEDDVWQDIGLRFVIVSDEIFSYFVEQACEVVTRIKVDDETGTVAPGALFNQEQVPSETMFYAVIGEQKDKGSLGALKKKLEENGNIIQVGGDETIGLGYCSVNLII